MNYEAIEGKDDTVKRFEESKQEFLEMVTELNSLAEQLKTLKIEIKKTNQSAYDCAREMDDASFRLDRTLKILDCLWEYIEINMRTK